MIQTLGCNNVRITGHIDAAMGIFGILEEKLRYTRLKTIIPAHENTSCKCRRTLRCYNGCSHAIQCVVTNGKVHYKTNKKM